MNNQYLGGGIAYKGVAWTVCRFKDGVAKIREEGEIPQCTLSVTTVSICLRFCFLSLLEIKGIELSD